MLWKNQTTRVLSTFPHMFIVFTSEFIIGMGHFEGCSKQETKRLKAKDEISVKAGRRMLKSAESTGSEGRSVGVGGRNPDETGWSGSTSAERSSLRQRTQTFTLAQGLKITRGIVPHRRTASDCSEARRMTHLALGTQRMYMHPTLFPRLERVRNTSVVSSSRCEY